MSQPIRYGIVGTGMMGCEHIQNIVRIPGTEVVALADPHPASLDAARLACGPQPNPVATFSSVTALLEGCELDAVVIATPNWTHAEVLEPIFESDLHVLVEKPSAQHWPIATRCSGEPRAMRASSGLALSTGT